METHRASRVPENMYVLVPEKLKHRQHRVRHRCAVGRLYMKTTWQLPVRMTQNKQRAPLVVVEVGVAHTRAIYHQALVQQRRIAFRDTLQLVDEIRQQPYVIAVDLAELQYRLLLPSMV